MNWASFKVKARAGRLAPKRAGEMNNLETEYARHLALLKQAGEIAGFDYEPAKLRLAKNTFYTPDFRVVLADSTVEYHEVKGFWEDDARVKIKVAAELHPYRFVAVSKQKGAWKTEEF